MALESAQHELNLLVVVPSLAAVSDLLARDSEILLSHEPGLLQTEQPSGTPALQITSQCTFPLLSHSWAGPKRWHFKPLQSSVSFGSSLRLLQGCLTPAAPWQGLGREGQCQYLQFHQSNFIPCYAGNVLLGINPEFPSAFLDGE